jgi:hypothetical protein
MAGGNSAGEKQPEPGAAPAEQMTDNTDRMTVERDERPPVSSDNATGAGQKKNPPSIASPGRESTPGNQRQAKKGAVLDRSLQKRIGSALRDSFADIEHEALPEHLQDLIKALQAKEQSRR